MFKVKWFAERNGWSGAADECKNYPSSRLTTGDFLVHNTLRSGQHQWWRKANSQKI